MKRLILLFSACVLSFALSAQVNYYVETPANGGDDAYDGLSETSAMATVNAAFDAALASFTAGNDSEYIINVGVGTFTTSMMSIGDCATNTLSLTFKGAGASSTTIQGGETLYSGTKLFDNLTGDNKNNENLTINLEDATFYNFSNAYTGGIINFNNTPANGATLNARRCVFKDVKAATGAIVRSNHAANANFYECSFVDVVGTGGALFHFERGHLTIENCVFDHCVRDYSSATSPGTVGILVYSAPSSNWVTSNMTLVNNTFVNCGVVNGADLTNDESLIHFNWAKNDGSSGVINLTIANNLFCGNTLEGMSDVSTYSDILISDNSTDAVEKIVYINSTNNILSSVNGFPATGNVVSDTLTFSSPELDFVLDGDDLEYFSSASGLIYVIAKGDLVVDQGLSSVQTTTDIIGTTRSVPGDIGAVEYLPASGQYITFDPIPAVYFSEASAIALTATASSGLPVSYTSSDESIATVSGNVLTPLAPGRVTITASQAGDASYDPADDVSQEWYLATDTAVYYVSESGDDSHDGLSEENAFLTLAAADAAIVAAEAANGLEQDYLVLVSGTVDARNCSFKTGIAHEVIIKGDGANVSTLQGTDDATYDAGGAFYRMFDLTGALSTNVKLSLEGLTIKNFGRPISGDANGGAIFNQKNDTVAVSACVITHGDCRSGAIVQTTADNAVFILKDSYISDVSTYNGSNVFSPIRLTKGEAYISNCVFDGLTKDLTEVSGKSFNDNSNGMVIAIAENAAVTVDIVNNTFFDCEVNDPSNQSTADQCVIWLDETNTITGTIANNLLIGNGTEDLSVVDIYTEATSLSALSITNNVANAISGFDIGANDTSSLYSYTATAIDFVMDGDNPQLFSTATGVPYVKADGTSVFGAGLASVATSYDIAGTERDAENPSVGAYESFGNVSTAYEASRSVDVQLYPNPVDAVLHVDGDVASIKVYSVAGQLLQVYPVLEGQVNVGTLAEGLYFVQVMNAEGSSVSTQHLIKK